MQVVDKHTMLDLAGELITRIGTPVFTDGLRTALNSLAPIDSFVLLSYQSQKIPKILCEDLYPEERDVFYDRYVGGIYQQSPYYQTSKVTSEPSFHSIAEIAPLNFTSSRYWQDYYNPAQIVDEVGYLLPVSAEETLLISIGRVGISDELSKLEINRFRDFLPIVVATTLQHWKLSTLAHSNTKRTVPSQLHLDEVLESFGGNTLTQRERQVLRLVIRGHSSKVSARLLEMSPGTERVHRRNIYRKLEVSSQAELSNLFIEMLSNVFEKNRQGQLL